MLRELLRILTFISNHPLAKKNKLAAFKKFFHWQLLQTISPKPRVCTFVEDSSLLIEKGMAGATGNIYCGLLEFEDMAFVLHLLRPGDLLGDVGANVGAYTVLAAKNANANVISIEPVPATFQHLKNNITLNKINERVNLINCGVAAENGELAFTKELDAVNHVAVPGETNSDNIITAKARTLDNIFQLYKPLILKIDVEGFEHEAIKGAGQLLKSETLKAIIIELNGSGMRYGFSDIAIHDQLMNHGFLPYAYEPFTRKLRKLEVPGHLNTLYLRGVDFIRDKIKTARKFMILGQEI